ncbi:hypothetical protein DFH09DRAFT_1375250 [Mycena vulgaris]|nr:hypothetical protein DFH09DRAFT_1375250 [Mycena vulgaris]
MGATCTHGSPWLPTIRPPPPSSPSPAARLPPSRADALHASQEALSFMCTPTLFYFRRATQLSSSPVYAHSSPRTGRSTGYDLPLILPAFHHLQRHLFLSQVPPPVDADVTADAPPPPVPSPRVRFVEPPAQVQPEEAYDEHVQESGSDEKEEGEWEEEEAGTPRAHGRRLCARTLSSPEGAGSVAVERVASVLPEREVVPRRTNASLSKTYRSPKRRHKENARKKKKQRAAERALEDQRERTEAERVERQREGERDRERERERDKDAQSEDKENEVRQAPPRPPVRSLGPTPPFPLHAPLASREEGEILLTSAPPLFARAPFLSARSITCPSTPPDTAVQLRAESATRTARASRRLVRNCYYLSKMKAAAITAILAASLATAEVNWTFQKLENGVEVPFPAGPATRFQSQAMIKVGEAGTHNRLSVAAAPIQSSNWCGAILTGSGFTSVIGTWTVPLLSLRLGQSAASEPGLSQWIGIDGFTSPGLLQGGVLSQIVSGGQENVAFTGLLPQPLRDLSLAVSTGDSITTNVTVTSSSGGIVTMRNNSRGSAVVATVTGATGPDIIQGSSLVVFPAFPTSSFTGASAIESGTSVSPPAGTTIDLFQGFELCSATISGTTVSVRDS